MQAHPRGDAAGGEQHGQGVSRSGQEVATIAIMEGTFRTFITKETHLKIDIFQEIYLKIRISCLSLTKSDIKMFVCNFHIIK